MNDNLQEGTVKWFDPKKGFGFIFSKNTDYFIHFREIQNEDGYKSLNEGERVSFVPSTSPKGPIATLLKKLK